MIIKLVPDKLGFWEENPQDISFDDAKKMADHLELDLFCINEKQSIYTITNSEKYEYMLKKHTHQKQKRQKTVKIKNAIGDADLARKLLEILEFKQKGHPVRIEITISPRYNNSIIKARISAFLLELAKKYKFTIPDFEKITIINI